MMVTHNVTIHDLHHLYLDTAMDYAVARYGYDKASRWWKTASFWAVWKIVWIFINKELLDEIYIKKRRPEQLYFNDYAAYMLQNSLRYNIGERAQKELHLI
jgi:hypothetical protein